jgi:glycosyltransferase involved in cell wall biosynthesis
MDEVKNTLYLSYDGMTDPLGQSQVLPYLTGLSKNGFTIHLISFEKKDRFQQYEKVIQTICDKENIKWHPLTYTKKPPLLSTMKDVRKMRNLAIKIVKKEKVQIVHCRSYLSALVGLGLKNKLGTQFLFDMRGFWADERIDGKIWSLKNPVFSSVYRYFKRKEILFFKHADHIVSLTENGKKEIESWKEFKDQKLPFSIIPCCVDLDLFDPRNISEQQKTQLKKELGVSDEKILGYIGSIGTWYMLPEMLDFFKVWKTKNKNGKFLFVTGENPASITKIAEEKSISQEDLLITSCMHNEVPAYISLMDLSVFFIRPTYSKKASSPTKQGEIMAMGIPLVCNAGVGDTDRIVIDNNSGYVLSELNESSYLEAVEKPFDFDPKLIQQGAKQTFDLENGVKEYTDIYERLWKK